MAKLTPRDVDFNEWYNTLVLMADMAEHGPVRGSMIVKPYGWALWENLQAGLDRRFKETGHQNAGFPLFIPESFIKREAKHVEGFAPELAIVTHAGGEELEEPLVVRPTSETVIGYAFSKWVQSYRDLPILINLWNSVVRWELRTKLFIRSSEFYWQEGHTAHATQEEAAFETRQMLDIYADFAINDAAIPVISGEKSESERFAGADRTFSIEAMMGDRRGLQAGTSHNLGQNFSKAFDIRYLDQNNELQYCWTTSWGLSTRFIGAIIMVHGDDQGLVMPPRLAPYQAVIVPIFRNDEEKALVMESVYQTSQQLTENGIRVKVDDRDHLTPGFKFNDWEMRGVPVRVEIGPRDVAKGSVALARRDIPGRDGKQFVPQEGLPIVVSQLLEDIHQAMYAKAQNFLESHTYRPKDYGELKEAVKDGFVRVWWDGTTEDEMKIKEETKATLRCLPLDKPEGKGICIYSGRETDRVAVFGRGY
ncbi:MAG TPA: proline--tRNA ligase [candidate division Zixibacteria bacterium]|nr:proline--tRNA ligase [candidate division Zixibacteria bacterium]